MEIHLCYMKYRYRSSIVPVKHKISVSARFDKTLYRSITSYATVLYGQFIVIMADETATTVGGCSTDSSVHVIKTIEQMTGVQMFNRTLLAFFIKDKVQTVPQAQLNYALENGLLSMDTLYFNNLVNTKATLETEWLQPISKSWLAQSIKVQ